MDVTTEMYWRLWVAYVKLAARLIEIEAAAHVERNSRFL